MILLFLFFCSIPSSYSWLFSGSESVLSRPFHKTPVFHVVLFPILSSLSEDLPMMRNAHPLLQHFLDRLETVATSPRLVTTPPNQLLAPPCNSNLRLSPSKFVEGLCKATAGRQKPTKNRGLHKLCVN